MRTCRHYNFAAVASVLFTLLHCVSGAPPYTHRQPHKEPQCQHSAHDTLCWTVQLRKPLHFKLSPLEISSPLDSVLMYLGTLQLPDAGNSNHVPKASNTFHLDGYNHSEKLVANDVSLPMQSKLKYRPFGQKKSAANNAEMSSKLPELSIANNAELTFSAEPNLYESVNGLDLDDSEQSLTEQDDSVLHTDAVQKTINQQHMDTEEILSAQSQKMYVYHRVAMLLAEEIGLTLLGKVGELYDHFVLCHEVKAKQGDRYRGFSTATVRAFQHYHKAHTNLQNSNATMFEEIRYRAETALHHHHDVAWFAMESVHHRQKRSTSLSFNDPAFSNQWHLVNMNRAELGMDINVTGVWQSGFIGRGITVAVVDDGLEWKNPDLHLNYNFLGSWDLNDNDPDPMPNTSKVSNHHGTRCAGEIAAVANNSVCGVGVAFGAKVSGIRLLDGPMTDSLEAEAFNKKFDINAIYSCSWGPDDDGKTVDGPHLLAAKAMKYGVDFGRNGYGSIFVVASGNGGSKKDNCNYDGYANSIYTVTIGAVDESGGMPYYAEECASMLGVTFSSGTASRRDIVTTDWQQKGGTGCTDQHTGTSAAAPLAAGMIALMLSAQPCLTWRDVQYILIITSVKIDQTHTDWQRNGAGLEHSYRHGFGLISAWRLVNAARVWRSVPWMTSYSTEEVARWDIPRGLETPLTIGHTVTSADISGYSLYMLEYVQVTLTLSHPVRGKLEIRLLCPSGTESVIGAQRPHDNSTDGFTDWTFTTVRCWGEAPVGDWTLIISDALPVDSSLQTGQLTKWRLTLFGTPMTTEEFHQRRQEVENAMSGQFLTSNFTPQCDPPPVTSPPYIPLSEKMLKILFLSGIFCLVFALYETMEYMLCYNEEKREQVEEAQRASARHRTHSGSDQSSSETALLLQDSSEQDSQWLRQSQAAFEEEEDDLFLFDAGASPGRIKGERSRSGVPEQVRIPMSLISTNNSRQDLASGFADISPKDLAERPAANGFPEAGAAAETSEVLSQQEISVSSLTPNIPGDTVPASGVWVEDSDMVSGPARNSILPDMWKALSQVHDSDSDTLEDELFSQNSASSVSLFPNGVRKSHR